MLSKEEEKLLLKEVFKCFICLEICSNFMILCIYFKGCGRFLGCFICFYYVDKCFLCCKEFFFLKERKLLIILGLESIFGVFVILFLFVLF